MTESDMPEERQLREQLKKEIAECRNLAEQLITDYQALLAVARAAKDGVSELDRLRVAWAFGGPKIAEAPDFKIQKALSDALAALPASVKTELEMTK
jgi:hypothetical protein